MTRTIKLVGATVFGLALVFALGAAGVRAQGPGPGGAGMRGPGAGGGPGGMLRGLRGLDLTDTQREQVQAAVKAHEEAFKAMRTRARTAHQALHEATVAVPFDEASIRQRAADVAIVDADSAVLRARVHADVWALLTPEQQQKAAALRAEMQRRGDTLRDRIDERRSRRQGRRGQRPI